MDRGSSYFDGNEDQCAICHGDGGLVCCDSCPKAYHMQCINLLVLPTGDFYCPLC